LVEEDKPQPNVSMSQEEQCISLVVEEEKPKVSITTLKAIQNFIRELSTVITENKNFMDYLTIVNRIDESKVKSYTKLISGFRVFFDNNMEPLSRGDFKGLEDPNISYNTDNGSFSFNFQLAYGEVEDEEDQNIIKDHLNHILDLLNKGDQGPEEIYIDKIFTDLKSKFSPDLTREEQMAIAKDLFNDFQRQNLDISIVVKVACQKARELLLSNGTTDSKTLVLIDAVEEIDVNNFDMIQFMGLIGKVGTLFSDGENNPLNGLLSTIFTDNMIPIENLNLDED
jgi:hypothetical protein